MKKKSENIIQFQYDAMLMNNLLSHFFASHENVYIFDSNDFLGVISYEDFLSNIDSISHAIKEVPVYSENHDSINHDLFVVLGENKILYEYQKDNTNPMDIRIRFDDLYQDNDKIIHYLRSLNIKRIAIFGSQREKFANYIDMYGNTFEVVTGESIDQFMEELDSNTLIIDTDSEIISLKEKLFESFQLTYKKEARKPISLEELCNLSEYYYFVHTVKDIPGISVSVLSFPDIQSLQNLTDEEKFRIAFDHHYRYYYDRYKDNPYIDSILRNVFGPFYSDEFIESRNHLSNVYLKAGRCFLEDNDNPYCSSHHGERTTTDQNRDYHYQFHVFGPCLTFGALVDDAHTICSYLQRRINTDDFDYRVHNYGARAIGLVENIRSFDAVPMFLHDYCLFVALPEERKILESFGFHDFIDLKPVLEDSSLRNYFIDEPVHCNHDANEKIANYSFEKIKDVLLKRVEDESIEVIPLTSPNTRDIFHENNYLKEYLAYLEDFRRDTPVNGSIVMNCNPFTLGHSQLIEYASSQVDTLYVFVVEEDKSFFDFQERFEMVKEGCKNFSNVIVIPSGKLLASALLFPDYFNKEDNPDIEVDCSFDRDVFARYIAPSLNITKRFLGEENFDHVTRFYNQDLLRNLPLYGIDVEIIPRFQEDGEEISAKRVRRAYQEGDWTSIERLVPDSTIKVLKKKRGVLNEL